MRYLVALSMGLALVLTPLSVDRADVGRPAYAQDIQRIAAIVNEDVISMYDLVSRLRLVVVTSRLPDTAETRRRLVPQVLRSLIDEQLQLQEAKRLNLTVGQQEIDRAIATLEKQNNLAPGTFGDFLAQANLEKSTVVAQLRANFAWQKVVAQRVRPRVRVSDEEIDEVLRQVSRNQSRLQFQFSEIFLSVDTPDQEVSVRDTAQRLSQQIRDGASFGVLARQFSQSASASVDGDVGWVEQSQLQDELAQALASMGPGQVSDPIRTRSGFYILRLANRRSIQAGPNTELSVTLHQIHIKHAEGASADDILAQKKLADSISETAKSCADMAKLGQESGVTTSAGPIKVKVAELAEEIRPYAEELSLGRASPAISKDDGISVIMVCERDTPANLPQRNEVRQKLARERLNVLMRRYLRDLRLGAFLEVRV